MNEVNVFNETEEIIDEIALLEKIAFYTLQEEGVNNAECGIIIVDEETIKNINKEYRHIDKVTDVISFALEDDKEFTLMEHRVLGDIYICLNRAKRQSIEYGHSLKRELCFLTVHGLLHLLGYDHMEPKDEEKMFKRQEEILDGYGITR